MIIFSKPSISHGSLVVAPPSSRSTTSEHSHNTDSSQADHVYRSHRRAATGPLRSRDLISEDFRCIGAHFESTGSYSPSNVIPTKTSPDQPSKPTATSLHVPPSSKSAPIHELPTPPEPQKADKQQHVESKLPTEKLVCSMMEASSESVSSTNDFLNGLDIIVGNLLGRL
jgi:hypothetical protein